MPNILHRIGFEGTHAQRVYLALTTLEGLAAWWTPHVSGRPDPGGLLIFGFPDGGPEISIAQAEPFSAVKWRCAGGIDEWIGTWIHFDIQQQPGETVLLFKHIGWRAETELMHHCSTQWAYFLLGLKEYIETGAGRPFGERNVPISRWSPTI